MRSMNGLKADVIIIGGGAAGLFAAVHAAQAGCRTLLLEQNDRLGKKLLITGKGRCNVTNDCSAEEVLKNVPRNSRFLYSCMGVYPPERAMAFFEELGCPLKVERGNRVFPQSDRSQSVLQALQKGLKQYHVQHVQARALQLDLSGGRIAGVQTDQGDFTAPCVILATGGCSYPLTGSDGSGYELARQAGHTIVEPEGSLVPLEENGSWCKQMQGLSLRNVGVKLVNQKNKVVFEDFGELLFTHFGLSGPTILSASAHMSGEDSYEVRLNLKPALDEQKLDSRILRDFAQYQNRNFENALQDLFHKTMIPVMVRRTGIDPEQKVNTVTKAQRRTLLELTKRFPISIAAKRPVEEAIITSGGVKVQQVDPKTMASKLAPGLYFAGEILDVDAYTGGFNLQIAWATAYAAAMAVAQKISN